MTRPATICEECILLRRESHRLDAAGSFVLGVIVTLGVLGLLAHCTAPRKAYAALPPNYETVVCEVESRAHETPDFFIGPAGEVGRCSITLDTLHTLGYRGSYTAFLTNPALSYIWAREVLRDCQRHGHWSHYQLAACYNAGPHSNVRPGHQSHRYAMEVSLLYRSRRMAEWKRTGDYVAEITKEER